MMYGRTPAWIFRFVGIPPVCILPQPFLANFGKLLNIANKAYTTQKHILPRNQASQIKYLKLQLLEKSELLQPLAHQLMGVTWVASTTSVQQKELTKVKMDQEHGFPKEDDGKLMAMELVKAQLVDMVKDIHTELDAELLSDSELSHLAKYVIFIYYFVIYEILAEC